MEEWKSSFREIYGRSPGPKDIDIIPVHLKETLKSEKKQDAPKFEKQRGTKRKNIEMKMMDGENFSPIKKRVNTSKLGSTNDENPFIARSSPRKKMQSLEESPLKSVLKPFPFEAKSPGRRQLSFQSPITSPYSSPKKKLATPGTGRRVNFDDFSPLKAFTSASKPAMKTSLTPIKSPTKKVYQRQLVAQKELDMLLMPTPEKNEEEEAELEGFDDETNEEVAAAKPARRLGFTVAKKKTNDQNYQKINLRKKQFVRGKVTAEQKRKMKRKQMLKKRN